MDQTFKHHVYLSSLCRAWHKVLSAAQNWSVLGSWCMHPQGSQLATNINLSKRQRSIQNSWILVPKWFPTSNHLLAYACLLSGILTSIWGISWFRKQATHSLSSWFTGNMPLLHLYTSPLFLNPSAQWNFLHHARTFQSMSNLPQEEQEVYRWELELIIHQKLYGKLVILGLHMRGTRWIHSPSYLY